MIQLFHVHKQYSGEAPSLLDVSLGVEKGEFVFLTGPSGAGKSTLMRLVFCAEAATSGQLLVFGRNVAKVKPSQIPYLRRSIGVVFQDFKLLPDRTVAENVAFPLEVRGLHPREVKRKVSAILGSVGLELKAGKFPLSLSGGEQQRVAVARALVGDPALLLADEPTGEPRLGAHARGDGPPPRRQRPRDDRPRRHPRPQLARALQEAGGGPGARPGARRRRRVRRAGWA